MNENRLFKRILIWLLGFLSIGAIYGGAMFIIIPDGTFFQIPLESLNNSPFTSFLIPGIILFIVFGLLPAYTIYALIKKPEIKILDFFNLLYDHHFSWTFSIYIGIGLIIWINIQTLIFNAVHLLHTIYSSLGIIIVCIALLPATRKHYKK